MEPTPENIETYAEKISDGEPALLKELNRETQQKILQPRMLSGHLQGRVLSLLSKLTAPKTILEIGTYTGYSALCLAEGLQTNGKLHTIDKNEELFDFQRKYFDQSPFGQQIIQHTGNALDIIPKLNDEFDLVFIDADKTNYSNYFDLILPKTKKGGIILSDNILWDGKVLEPTKKGDADTKALKAYSEKLHNENQIENVLLPVRDGLLVSRKI